MRRFTIHALIVIATLLLLAGCSSDNNDESSQEASGPVRIDISQDTQYLGWDTVKLRNAYTEFDILPEFGGRIMGYNILGSRLLWHDAAHEGEIGDFNPGGAWIVPAGADLGDWPAAEMSPYETMVYESTATDTTYSMTSIGNGDYRIAVEGNVQPRSTIVRQHCTLERTASGSAASGLRQVISVPVAGETTVYAPVANGGWQVIAGGADNPQWLGVENGMFRARYDRRYGRVGLKLREGWIAWRNASDGLAYVVRLPIDAGTYPGGYNVEIRTPGGGDGPGGPMTYNPETARMEIVIMSRVENLDSGESLTMDISWESCRVSDIVDVFPRGILSQDFRMRDGRFTGKFGVFQGGILQYLYLDANKEIFGRRTMFDITPINEVVIDHGMENFTFPDNMKYLGFIALDLNRKDMQEFGDIEIVK